MRRLTARDPRAARIVEMRLFAGMCEEDVAFELGVGLRTVERDWAHAKAWLRRDLSREKQKEVGP